MPIAAAAAADMASPHIEHGDIGALAWL